MSNTLCSKHENKLKSEILVFDTFLTKFPTFQLPKYSIGSQKPVAEIEILPKSGFLIHDSFGNSARDFRSLA